MDSGFVPIIPSQADPHPSLSANIDSEMNPIFAEQNFFPSYYRTGYQLPPARPFSYRHFGSQSSTSGRYSSTPKASFDESILGSGDFAVLRGGTFYAEGEPLSRPNLDYYGSGSSFHDSTNTGRPFALPLESSHYSDDPFADFKDFADITANIDSDFSHFVAVYANKSSSLEKHEPKNILEQLQMIDEEKINEQAGNQRAEATRLKPISVAKLSKFKLKLLNSKIMKELQTKKETDKRILGSASDYIDPLVADS